MAAAGYSIPASDNAFAGPPALLFGPAGSTRSNAADLIRSAGVRLADVDGVDYALDRIALQLAASMIWVEAAQAPLPDSLLDCLRDKAERDGWPIVLSIAPEQIDSAAALLGDGNVQLLVDPDDGDRAGALAVALAAVGSPAQVSDVGRDNSVRLRQLSDEMGRIAATLARLSSGPQESGEALLRPVATGQTPVSIETVRSVIRARRLRARFFSEELFADPAWDMLLDLFQAELAQLRVPVSSLCIAAAVPATTALRWIKSMTDAGLFVRRPDPHDGRRVFVELSPDASRTMHSYFAELGMLRAG